MTSITLYHYGVPIVHNPIYGGRYTIGSHPGNDMVLEGEGVADTHLVLQRRSDGCWVSKHADYTIRGTQRTMKPGKLIRIGAFAVEIGDALKERGTFLNNDVSSQIDNLDMAGDSVHMSLLRSELIKLAALSAPVLITGETGTGKELAARALHNCSPNADGPFIAVNCGSLTATMIEDILFGHDRGAFTSAEGAHRGVFERAHGGTLFLDEIGELPQTHQAALLRVLDNKIVNRLGGEQERTVDFRLVTATNQDLLQMIKTGLFRGDLYHRMSTFMVKIPPLRDRMEDVRAIAQVFLKKMEQEFGPKELSIESLEILRNYRWLGNARELRNVLYRAAARCDNYVIKPGDLDLDVKQKHSSSKSIINLKDISDIQLISLLDESERNITALSKRLGIPRTTLRDRVRRILKAN